MICPCMVSKRRRRGDGGGRVGDIVDVMVHGPHSTSTSCGRYQITPDTVLYLAQSGGRRTDVRKLPRVTIVSVP
jgi:hypothetical protein